MVILPGSLTERVPVIGTGGVVPKVGMHVPRNAPLPEGAAVFSVWGKLTVAFDDGQPPFTLGPGLYLALTRQPKTTDVEWMHALRVCRACPILAERVTPQPRILTPDGRVWRQGLPRYPRYG